MPLRDDWASAAELIRQLDRTISSDPCSVRVLLVDDGSVQGFRPADFQSRFAAVQGIRVLRLRRNLGHQRAIAIGLVHVEKAIPCDAVLVMDGDGEDTPDGALRLLRAFSGTTAIFAERSRRTLTEKCGPYLRRVSPGMNSNFITISFGDLAHIVGHIACQRRNFQFFGDHSPEFCESCIIHGTCPRGRLKEVEDLLLPLATKCFRPSGHVRSVWRRDAGRGAAATPTPDTGTRAAFRKKDLREAYETVLLYNIEQELSDTERKNFQGFVEDGKGVIVLHHAIADYNNWPWFYEQIAGGKYCLKAEDGHRASTYKHDIEIFVEPGAKHAVIGDIGPSTSSTKATSSAGSRRRRPCC